MSAVFSQCLLQHHMCIEGHPSGMLWPIVALVQRMQRSHCTCRALPRMSASAEPSISKASPTSCIAIRHAVDCFAASMAMGTFFLTVIVFHSTTTRLKHCILHARRLRQTAGL